MKLNQINFRPSKKVFFMMLILLVFSISISSSVIAFSNTDKESILETLNTFYDSAKNENLTEYYSAQEMEYYEKLYENKETYKSHIQSTFDAFEIESYEISNQAIMFDNDSALIFYHLNSKVILSETGERKNIDNDMVALLFPYPDGWKIRWTILHSLFEQKLLNEVIFEAAIEDAVFQTENTTLKEEFNKEGIAIQLDDEILKPKKKNYSSYFLIGSILIILTLIYLFKQFKLNDNYKIKTKKTFKNFITWCKTTNKEVIIWFKTIAIPKTVIFSKKTWKQISLIKKKIQNYLEKLIKYVKSKSNKSEKK